MEVLSILQPILGTYRKSTHTRDRQNYAFFCPFCRHYKQKLEIDIVSGNWHCWTCDAKGKTPYSLLKRLSASRIILDRVRVLYRNTTNHTYSGSVLKPSSIQLPGEFRSLNSQTGSHFQKIAQSYLKSRNISNEDVERYGIGYCEDGKYLNRIIIPNYNEFGMVDYWVGRSFQHSPLKYAGPESGKDIVGFELLISWDFPVILCEGALDAIAIRRNAIPLYGKTLSERLKEKIIEEHPPAVYIALDPDAYKDTIKIAEYLINAGLVVYIVELKDGDPSEIGFKRFWELMDYAKRIDDIFELKMKMEL